MTQMLRQWKPTQQCVMLFPAINYNNMPDMQTWDVRTTSMTHCITIQHCVVTELGKI